PLALVDDDYEAGANVRGEQGHLYVTSGTSFAAPHVAGDASLLFSVNPRLTARQVRNMLLQSAVDIEKPGVDPLSGYGRLDAAAALAADPDFYIEALITGVATARQDGALVVQVLGDANADSFASARLEIGEGEDPEDWTVVEPKIEKPVRGGVMAAVPAALLRSAPRWTIRIVVEHENGRSREARFDLALK
ncbi:MAG: S8 family serine peptidase, partial [Halioglobus sp.]|nr:S8 family serine peptidase [Halioglobus sp.]